MMMDPANTRILTFIPRLLAQALGWLLSPEQRPDAKAGQLACPPVIQETVGTGQVAVNFQFRSMDVVQTLERKMRNQ